MSMRSRQTTVLLAAVVGVATCFIGELFNPLTTLAERFDSASYSIQYGNFNITSGEKSSGNYKVTDTVGQIGAGPYGTIGAGSYFVGGGFQYIYPLRDFEFSLSALSVDFGTLVANTHVARSHTLTVTTRAAGGYKVYAAADHALRHQNGSATIPQTTCDGGGCTISAAASWTNQSKAGFGYNMSGQDVPTDFVSTNYFRPFADLSQAQAKQVVMSSASVVLDHQATITYKAGAAATQTAGAYSTVIKFIAVPAY